MIRALPHRFNGRFDARIGGEQNDKRIGVAFLEAFQDGETVAVGQTVIEQNQIDAFLTPGEGAGGGLCLEHPVPFGLQTLGERPADQLLVVDDEDGGRLHGALV